MTSFNGPEAVNVFRLITLKVALSSFASQIERNGRIVMIPSRGVTPSHCVKLAKAEGYKGKARDYRAAADFLAARIDEARALCPPGSIAP